MQLLAHDLPNNVHRNAEPFLINASGSDVVWIQGLIVGVRSGHAHNAKACRRLARLDNPYGFRLIRFSEGISAYRTT